MSSLIELIVSIRFASEHLYIMSDLIRRCKASGIEFCSCCCVGGSTDRDETELIGDVALGLNDEDELCEDGDSSIVEVLSVLILVPLTKLCSR